MSKEPSVIMTANGTLQTTEEATVFVFDLDMLVQVQLLKESLAVQLCAQNGSPYEWHPGQPSYLIKNWRQSSVAILLQAILPQGDCSQVCELLFMNGPHERTPAVDCYGGRPRSPVAAVPPAQGGGIQILGTATVLFLHASGRTADLETDSDGVSHTAPIYEGYVKILNDRGCSFTATSEREIVPDVIEKLRYIGLDTDTELKSTAELDNEKTYVFPDRNIITVGAERLHCVEALFQPGFTGKKASGFHDTSLQSNMECDVVRRCRVVRWHDHVPRDF